MNGVDLRALLKRLEELPGAHRGTDLSLHDLMPDAELEAPHYTLSIDAAMRLVCLLFPDRTVDIHINLGQQYYGSQIVDSNALFRVTDNSAPTPAISILKCLVTALIAKAEAEEGVGEF